MPDAVPAIFDEWPFFVLDAAEVRRTAACSMWPGGTGVLAQAAAERSDSVTGLDLNPGMLAVAAEQAPSVDWRQGDAADLPFPDASFDAVVSQFGLMFFPDRAKALAEMLRVLKPSGRIAVAVWDRLEKSPAYSVEVAILERMAGPQAADALLAPFALGDAGELKQLFLEAGVAEPQIQTRTGLARFPSIRALAEADLRGWLPLVGVHLSDEKIEEILLQVELELNHLIEPDDTFVFESPAHIVSGARSS
ncbi:MAG: methyltransferase domain-containing protein [Bryobacterales bacterium]